MSKIIKRLQPEVIKRTAARCRVRGIVLPTFAQLRNPELVPPAIKRKLKGVGLWDVNPVNLFRSGITIRAPGEMLCQNEDEYVFDSSKFCEKNSFGATASAEQIHKTADACKQCPQGCTR